MLEEQADIYFENLVFEESVRQWVPFSFLVLPPIQNYKSYLHSYNGSFHEIREWSTIVPKTFSRIASASNLKIPSLTRLLL